MSTAETAPAIRPGRPALRTTLFIASAAAGTSQTHRPVTTSASCRSMTWAVAAAP
jgi:hypothetical protein